MSKKITWKALTVANNDWQNGKTASTFLFCLYFSWKTLNCGFCLFSYKKHTCCNYWPTNACVVSMCIYLTGSTCVKVIEKKSLNVDVDLNQILGNGVKNACNSD